MRVKPRLAYRHAGWPPGSLDPNKVYEATIATSQPNYKVRGLVFVGPNDLLLTREEYTIIEET